MADDDHRHDLIRALLRSRYDYLPTPLVATGLVVRDAGIGPAPGKRVPCDLCLRSGTVLRRVEQKTVRRICPLCEGMGWRRRRKGDEEWDEYLERPLRTASGAPREPFRLADDVRRLSAQIERLEADERARQGNYSRERFGWEAERWRMDRLGSYRELEQALAGMGAEWPEAYWVLYVAYWRGLPITLSPRHRGVEADAVVWLSDRLPEELRIPPWLSNGRAQVKRRTVQDLHAEGLSPGKIAHRLGLTRKKVRRILGAE